MKTDKGIIQLNDGKVPKRLTEEFIKKGLTFLIEDELWERIYENPNENLLSTKITFKDLFQTNN